MGCWDLLLLAHVLLAARCLPDLPVRGGVCCCSMGLRVPVGMDFRQRRYWLLGGAAGAWRLYCEDKEGQLWVRGSVRGGTWVGWGWGAQEPGECCSAPALV